MSNTDTIYDPFSNKFISKDQSQVPQAAPTPAPAPAAKTPPSAPGSNFSLDDLIAAQAEQSKRRAAADSAAITTTTAEQANARKNAVGTVNALVAGRKVLTASQGSAAAADDSRRFLMQDQADLMDIAQQAIKLSNSSDPKDHLELWWKQLHDPRWTKEYNTQRQGFINTTSSTVDTLEAVRQNAYSRQLAKISEDLKISQAKGDLSLIPLKQQQEMADMLKQQGQAAVDSLVKTVTERAQAVAADQSLQENAISGLSDEQIAAAHDAASKSPDGKVNVGGVNMSLGTLTTANDARSEQSFQRLVRSSALSSQNEELRAKSLLKTAQTFTVGELDRAIMAGGKIDNPDGTSDTLPLDQLKAIRATKADALQSFISDQANLTGIGDGHERLKQAQDYLNAQPPAPVGSPVWSAQNSYQSVLGMGAQTLGAVKPGTPEFYDSARIVFDATGKARENLDAAIETEAVKQGAGDKFNTELARNRLAGRPAPADLIEQETVDRLMSGKSVADIHGNAAAASLTADYYKQLGLLRSGNITGMATGTVSQKDLQAQAAAVAYDNMLNRVAGEQTQDGVHNQVLDPTHPLYGKLGASQFTALEMEADQTGTQEFQRNHNLTPEELQKFMNGETVKGISTRSNGTELVTLQQSAFFDKVATNFGIETASAISDWWGSENGRAYITKYRQAVETSGIKSNDRNNYVKSSLAGPRVEQELNLYGVSSAEGLRDFSSDRLDRELSHFRAFGNQPQAYQTAALTRDDTLSDTDRQDALTKIIGPLMIQANGQGLSYEDANKFVESKLRTMAPDDPSTKSLLKKILKNRNETLTDMENMLGLQIQGYKPKSSLIPGIPANGKMTGALKWYYDIANTLPKQLQPANPWSLQGN